MSAPYSIQLFCNAIGAGLSVFYVVPPGTRIILRDLELYNGSGGSSSLSLSVEESAGVLLAVVVNAQAQPAGQTLQWQGRAVVNSGQRLSSYSDTGNWRILASGYELTL